MKVSLLSGLMALACYFGFAQTNQNLDSLAAITYNASFDIVAFDEFVVTTKGQVYNLANSSSPNLVGSFSPPAGVITAYFYQRPYLYVGSGQIADFLIIDMTFPFAPNAIGSISFGSASIFGITVTGQHAYLALDNSLVSVDISNPTAPVPVDTLPFPNQVRDVGASGCQVFVSGPGGLNNVDISDPANLSLIGGFGSGFVDLDNYGDTVFVSGSTGALQVISFSNPTSPLPLAGASTGAQMWGVEFRDNMIYASSDPGALYVYELTYPSLTPFAFYQASGGQGFDVTTSDSLVFLSSLVDGVRIFRLDSISPVSADLPFLFKPCTPTVNVDASLSRPSQWYPNPVGRGQMAGLRLSPDLDPTMPVEVLVWSGGGKRMGTWTGNGGTEIALPAGNWAAGLYGYEVRQNGRQVERGKFAVQ